MEIQNKLFTLNFNGRFLWFTHETCTPLNMELSSSKMVAAMGVTNGVVPVASRHVHKHLKKEHQYDSVSVWLDDALCEGKL
jgi:hypothetical protein